jgi:hypothetical protein
MKFSEETAGRARVELPIGRRQARVLASLFYLLIGGSYIVPFWHSFHRQRMDDISYGTIMVAIGLVTLWTAVSKVVIRVTPDALQMTTSGFGLSWTDRYPLSEISNLWIDHRRIFTYRPWLAFDRDGKQKFIGTQLMPGATDEILEPIYASFPLLNPEFEKPTTLKSN